MLGWLLNKYLVNMFSSVEDGCLNFICHSLQNRITAQHSTNSTKPSKLRVDAVLASVPSRISHGVFKDAAEVDCGRSGHHQETWDFTYFLTVTCNPNWPEIRNHPGMDGQGQVIDLM